METKIKNDFEALILALELAITAPDEKKANECVAITESLAINLTPEQVKLAKELVLKEVING
tara:strand:+ start:17 stop:202 length:186 start_codon:yes stop_codon:yes gene_type:complete